MQPDDYQLLVNLNNTQGDLRGTGSGKDVSWNATWVSAVGLWGTLNILQGVQGVADTLPPERCHRGCFLRRLVFAWAAVFTAVTPVMIYRLWDYFSAALN